MTTVSITAHYSPGVAPRPATPVIADASLFHDFCRFSKRQIETWDIDPIYPVLRWLNAESGLEYDGDEALWRTLLYVAFYKIASAEEAWTLYPYPQPIPDSYHLRLPTGVERRGFRGNGRAAEMVSDVFRAAEEVGGLSAWVYQAVGAGGEAGWNRVRKQFQGINGNGPWAGYKWSDLLKNVHEFDIDAPDIGVGGARETAGPIPGMARLTGRTWRECANDTALQKALLRAARERGVPFTGLDQLETCLCDFNTLCKGDYYTGHDIDSMMTGVPWDSDVWPARKAVLPLVMLGEWGEWMMTGEGPGGWNGVRKHLRPLYAEEKILL